MAAFPPGHTFWSLPTPGDASGSMPHPEDKARVGPNVSGVLCEGEQGRALGPGGAVQEGETINSRRSSSPAHNPYLVNKKVKKTAIASVCTHLYKKPQPQ